MLIILTRIFSYRIHLTSGWLEPFCVQLFDQTQTNNAQRTTHIEYRIRPNVWAKASSLSFYIYTLYWSNAPCNAYRLAFGTFDAFNINQSAIPLRVTIFDWNSSSSCEALHTHAAAIKKKNGCWTFIIKQSPLQIATALFSIWLWTKWFNWLPFTRKFQFINSVRRCDMIDP